MTKKKREDERQPQCRFRDPLGRHCRRGPDHVLHGAFRKERKWEREQYHQFTPGRGYIDLVYHPSHRYNVWLRKEDHEWCMQHGGLSRAIRELIASARKVSKFARGSATLRMRRMRKVTPAPMPIEAPPTEEQLDETLASIHGASHNDDDLVI